MNGFCDIVVLPIEETAFVKRITIPVKMGKRIDYVLLIYVRKPDPIEYKLNLCKQSHFSRCLNGILEKEYPNDNLDMSILKAIQSKYPDASMNTMFCLCNTDKEAIRRVSNIYPHRSTIAFQVIYKDVVSNLITSRDCGFLQTMQIYSNNKSSVSWIQDVYKIAVLEQEGLRYKQLFNDSIRGLQNYLDNGWK